jgi:hypothetical protein
MAKRRKVLPARKPRDRSRDDDSLLLRSAESLGRVIGALQRQLDEATQRLSSVGSKGTSATGARTRSRKTTGAKKGSRKTASARKAAGARKTTRSRKAAKKR